MRKQRYSARERVPTNGGPFLNLKSKKPAQPYTASPTSRASQQLDEAYKALAPLERGGRWRGCSLKFADRFGSVQTIRLDPNRASIPSDNSDREPDVDSDSEAAGQNKEEERLSRRALRGEPLNEEGYYLGDPPHGDSSKEEEGTCNRSSDSWRPNVEVCIPRNRCVEEGTLEAEDRCSEHNHAERKGESVFDHGNWFVWGQTRATEGTGTGLDP